MKRLLVLVAVLVPLSVFIAGCGGAGGSSGTPPTSEEQKQMEEEEMKRTQEMLEKGMDQATGANETPQPKSPGEAEKKE